MQITIVIAKSSTEKAEALKIRRLVFIQEQSVPESIEVDQYESTSIHFLAYLNKKPAGVGRFRIKKSYLKFERIATLKEYRGLGIGKELINFMQSYAIDYFSEYLPAMHAQASAISFYEKIGWTKVGEQYEEAGITHQTMILIPKNLVRLKVLEDSGASPDILKILLK